MAVGEGGGGSGGDDEVRVLADAETRNLRRKLPPSNYSSGREDSGEDGGSGGGRGAARARARARARGGGAETLNLSFAEGDLTQPASLVALHPAVKRQLSDMKLRQIPIAGNGWCGWASGAVHHDYDVMSLVEEVVAYYTRHQKEVLAWTSDFVMVPQEMNRANTRELNERVSKLGRRKVNWPSNVLDPASKLWLNTTSDMKVLAMMKGKSVHLIQQYTSGSRSGTALVTVFTSLCAPPRTQTYTLGDARKFAELGGPEAIIIVHDGTPGGTDGIHFNAVVPA